MEIPNEFGVSQHFQGDHCLVGSLSSKGCRGEWDNHPSFKRPGIMRLHLKGKKEAWASRHTKILRTTASIGMWILYLLLTFNVYYAWVLLLFNCVWLFRNLMDFMGNPARLLCPWDSPGKSTGVGYHFLLQEIFLIQGSNPRLLHWQVASFTPEPPGKPIHEYCLWKFRVKC